jgi:hypothetical protein
VQKYTNKITLTKNGRGVWDLDTLKGCSGGLNANFVSYCAGLEGFKNITHPHKRSRGCYGLCYAQKISKFRGYDFSKPKRRDFIDDKHLQSIGRQLQKIEFVRIGVSCDPSDDWEHTIQIIEKIRPFIENIVVITKHWNNLTYNQCTRLKGVCVNTSISALDSVMEIDRRLFWYNKLKEHCKSVLRVNTASFNDANLSGLQDRLLKNDNVIDNILRFTRNHELVKNGIVNVKEYPFLSGKALASKHDESVFFGYCGDCKEKCGLALTICVTI